MSVIKNYTAIYSTLFYLICMDCVLQWVIKGFLPSILPFFNNPKLVFSIPTVELREFGRSWTPPHSRPGSD